MVRTVISLDPEDKRWLDQKARAEQVPTAEVVRRALRRYREDLGGETPSVRAAFAAHPRHLE